MTANDFEVGGNYIDRCILDVFKLSIFPLIIFIYKLTNNIYIASIPIAFVILIYISNTNRINFRKVYLELLHPFLDMRNMLMEFYINSIPEIIKLRKSLDLMKNEYGMNCRLSRIVFYNFKNLIYKRDLKGIPSVKVNKDLIEIIKENDLSIDTLFYREVIKSFDKAIDNNDDDSGNSYDTGTNFFCKSFNYFEKIVLSFSQTKDFNSNDLSQIKIILDKLYSDIDFKKDFVIKLINHN